jgi:hypothetical protein
MKEFNPRKGAEQLQNQLVAYAIVKNIFLFVVSSFLYTIVPALLSSGSDPISNFSVRLKLPALGAQSTKSKKDSR